jgi:fatty acid desaturase
LPLPTNAGRDSILPMKLLLRIWTFVWKLAVIVATFFATFGVFVFTVASQLPGQNLILYGLLLLPYGWLVNRFILSPLEYRLDFRSHQYDAWYENRSKRKAEQTKNPKCLT